MDTVAEARDRLGAYCRELDYRGWDLFDGLNSSLFRATPLYRARIVRLAWIQFFKRSPVNLRKITGVPKDFNPKGLGLFASAMTAIGDKDGAKAQLDRLETMQCSGYDGVSWGYNFDWESRAFFVEQGTPNLVTTVFVANACLDYYEATRDDRYLQFADGACRFLLSHLVMFEDDSLLCFRYIPGEDAVVHNAYMLGAALLGRVFRFNRNERYVEASTKAMRKAIGALRPDFSWPYGERHHHQFIDNFHTGFNLVSLKQWISDTGDHSWDRELGNAYRYWLDTFFLEDGCPKYYHDQLYPIDVHCSAQGIVTCLKLKELDSRSLGLAAKIARWAIDNMQDEAGYFYYQKTRLFTNRISYIRWSQAWMFYALSLLIAEGADQ